LNECIVFKINLTEGQSCTDSENEAARLAEIVTAMKSCVQARNNQPRASC